MPVLGGRGRGGTQPVLPAYFMSIRAVKDPVSNKTPTNQTTIKKTTNTHTQKKNPQNIMSL